MKKASRWCFGVVAALALVLAGASARTSSAAGGTVLYRVNAGGPALSGSPGWSADTAASPSPYVNAAATGNTTYSTSATIDTSDPSLPAGTPAALFQTERYDQATTPEMSWAFPVSAGSYTVNLYFAEIYPGAEQVGTRLFNVAIEGQQVLSNFDVYAAVGANKGLMKSFTVSSDSTLNIDFSHVAGNGENPAIKGIEIISTTSSANTLAATPTSLDFGSVSTGTSKPSSVQLTNMGATGDPSITVSSASITGTDAAQFSTSFSGATLAPGQSTTVPVTFAPTSTGTKSASISFTHTGTNSPLSVPLTGTGASASQSVIYRVAAGGPALSGTPSWSADTKASPSPYVNAAATGNTTFGTTATIDTSDPSLPAGTPAALFQNERYDQATTPEMSWAFPVTAGTFTVRLYFAEIYTGAQQVGKRLFNVSIEGQQVLSNFDVYAAVGANKGLMKSFTVTSDSTLNIDFSHVAGNGENPEINGIEILGSGGGGGGTVGFGKSILSGINVPKGTSIQFGPDGKLYVADQTGLIHVLTVARSGANQYAVTGQQTITAIQQIPNHNDDGTLAPTVNTRIITGIYVTGTAANPVIYATSSDPRIGGGSSGTDTGLDTNSSMLSRLTWNGSSWVKLDLVRGLPRSEENHSSNGIALDPATNTLYIAQGGNTNMGAPSNNFAFLPEYALSAAILSVDLTAIGNTTYDLPTLDDDSRAGNPDANDPFGGDNGKNQAKLVPGGPVQVYAPGFRNPYDVLIAKSGKMYTIDNGANAGWGDVPINEGPAGNCTNGVNEPGTTDMDRLFLITGKGFYGGHPDPTRGNMANTFDSNNQSPVSVADPQQCDYRGPSVQPGITQFPASTNGLTEYTASDFNGAMTGDLLAASFDNTIYDMKLNSTGDTLVSKKALFSTVGSSSYGPLDVTATGDGGPFPGTIWSTDYTNGNIYVFEPNDFGGGGGGTCTGAYSTSLDEDHDGYTNADEIDNHTDPCSAADVPPDWDHDFISNLNDPDDDNDGIPDTSDKFAIDPSNGTSTNLPVRYTWDNADPSAGGLMNLGFTGLMTNGGTNYESLFDPAAMTAGGAAGVATVDAVPAGTALGATNTQQYGFQFGFNADPAVLGPFTAHTAIDGPFAGITPAGNDSMGLMVGLGDQDNYVKLVTAANGIQFVKEVGGTVTNYPVGAVTMPGPDKVDLYMTFDPAARTVQPSYVVTTGGVAGPRTNLGSPVALPATWFTSTPALAAGIISTSSGGTPFPATWDSIEVVNGTDGGASVGSWKTLAPTGLARSEISYVNDNGLFYLTGGQSTSQQVYNPSTDTWGDVAPFPASLDHIQSVTLNGLIYYIGGLVNWPSPAVGTVYIFNPATNTFTTGASMPRPRGAGGVAVFNGKIYYAGGLYNGNAVAFFDVYDPATNTWTQLPDMPHARDHFHAAVVNGKLWAIGGRVTQIDATIAANDAYNFSTGSWQSGFAPLPTPRGGFSVAPLGDEILVIGGEGGGKTYHTNEAYNTVTDSWRSLAPMPTSRHGTEAAVCNGGVYIADGGLQQGGGTASSVHEAFFLNGQTTCASAPDTTPPTVTGTSPASGATGVPAPSNVTATFSEAMAAGTISSSTFTLVPQGSSTPVAATVTYDTATKTATLDPASDLTLSGTYTATVKGGTGGVTDLAGNPLAANKTWSFTVASTATTTVAQDTFTRTVSNGWGTANTGGAWSLLAGSASTFAVNGSKGTIALPANGVQEVAHLASVSVRDVDATVEMTFPNSVSTGGVFSYFVMRRQSTGTYDRIGVYVDPGGTLKLRGQTDGGGSLFADVNTGLTFTPGNSFVLRVQLQGSSPTTVRVRAWRTGSTEPTTWSVNTTTSSGPQVAGSFGIRAIDTAAIATTLSFDNLLATQISGTDTTPPTVTATSPTSGATGVSASTNVTATFSEAMTAASISSSTFTLVPQGSSTPVAATVTYNSATNTATLAPASALTLSGTYTATVKGGSAGVKDLAGNPLAADKTWSFTVASAPPPPLAQDTFTRTVSGGWGTADTGGAWSVLTGSASVFGVNGTKGTIALPANGIQELAHLGGVLARDVDATMEVTFPNSVSTGGVFAYLVLRRQSGGTYDRIGVYVDPAGTLKIRGQTDAGTSLFADVDTGLAFTPGNSFAFHIQLQGASPTTVRVRAWRVGTAEPTTWNVNTTTSAGVQVAGTLGVRAIDTSATATTLSFDNLLATGS